MTRFFISILAFIVSWFSFSIAIAQPPDTSSTWTWDYGSDYEGMTCVAALQSGGYIACGYTWYFQTAVQCWTAKLDQDGNEIWWNIEGGDHTESGNYIEPTSDGGFIQCGETWSYATGNNFDAFVRKLDANGEQEWVRRFGHPVGADFFYCVREVPVGGYVAAGYSDDAHVYRLNNIGEILWIWEDPGTLYYPFWIEPTSDGGFIIPSERYNAEIQSRVFTLNKIDAFGNIVWITEEAVPGILQPGQATCVREDEYGFLYACGAVQNDSTYTDFYVSKRNSDGSVIWYLLIDNPNWVISDNDFAIELCLLADGNILVIGTALDDESQQNMVVAKISNDGELHWLDYRLGGEPTSVDQGRDGSLVISYFPYVTVFDDPDDLKILRYEPEVEIELNAWTPVIPETGGWLSYGTQVSNILIDPTPLDAWIVITGPNGNRMPLNNFPVTLQPGLTFTQPQINVYVPDFAPDGEYQYEIHLGDADTRGNMGLGSLTFVKGTVTRPDDGEWPNPNNSWNPFTGQSLNPDNNFPTTSEKEHGASEAFAISAHPNPFNAVSTIMLSLPDPSEVRISVYNTLGQEAMRLCDFNQGTLSPGDHQFQIKASSLSSGVYIIRANVAGHTLQRKIVVVN